MTSTITIDMPEDLHRTFAERARRRGLPLEDLLRQELFLIAYRPLDADAHIDEGDPRAPESGPEPV
jgi:hypothetical protein